MAERVYSDFLASKRFVVAPAGIPDPPPLSGALFPFQHDIVRWALRRGRAAIWADCGLGKGWMALEWGRVVSGVVGLPVLILAPLAVAQQFHREGEKLGVHVTVCREQGDVRPGVNVTNYDRLHRFSPAAFGGIVLDESSCLKDYTSATRNALIEAFARTPFRLACSATPAPNDHVELGNHAEFLGAMSRVEMLATFFCHDGGETQTWRLKGHARADFWRWLCSWAVTIRKPSDLGYDDAAFVLPPLNVRERVVSVGANFAKEAGTLFITSASGLTAQRAARRSSLDERVRVCAEAVNAEPFEPWLVWCDLNTESAALAASIPGSVEVCGSDTQEYKEQAARWFLGQAEAPCRGSPNITPPENCAPTPIPPSEPSETPKVRAQTQIASGHTCVAGSPSTESTSAPTGRRRKRSGTSGDASDTGPMSPSAKSKRPRPGWLTPPPSGTGICARCSESVPPNTIPSSAGRAEAAQSAGPSNAATPLIARDASAGCTSTTTTGPKASVASYADRAISALGSSQTIRRGSNELQPICAHRVLISKPSIFGWGLNFQHCARVAFVGLSNSFEAWYQAIRRTWRFGQQRAVECLLITSDADGGVRANLERKRLAAEQMATEMLGGMCDIQRATVRALARETDDYRPATPMRIPRWLRAEP